MPATTLRRGRALARLAAAFLFLALAACAPRPAPQPLTLTFLPSPGDFLSPDGDRRELEDLAALAAGADYVLFGEGHKTACDHRLEVLFLRALAATKRPFALGLEMVSADRQPSLDRFNEGRLGPDELAAELDWKTGWGYPFEFYRPLLVAAREAGFPVVGLNAPFDLARKAGKEGLASLPPEERAKLPATVLPQPPEQEAALLDIFREHKDRNPADREQVDRFFLVQSIWDTQMAQEAAEARKRLGRQVFVVAGAGHVEHGWGIAGRLRTLDPTARSFLIVPWRGEEPFTPAAADAFFHCPPAYQARMGMTLEVRQGRVLVTEVRRGSRADLAGLRPGDVVTAAQDLPVRTLEDLHRAGAQAYKAKAPFTLAVLRDGRSLSLDFGPLGQENPRDAGTP